MISVKDVQTLSDVEKDALLWMLIQEVEEIKKQREQVQEAKVGVMYGAHWIQTVL